MANSVATPDTGRIKRNVEKMISLGAPEAEIDGYLGTEGFTPQSFRQSMLEAKQPQRTTGERVTRSLGLGARNVVEGLTAFPGMLYDAAMLPVKGAIGAANYMGADIPQVAPAGQTISNAMTLAGLPQSETPSERVTGRVVQGATGALPTMGAGLLMQGAKAAPQVVRGVGGVLAGAPATQVVSGGTAGLTGGFASELGAGPVGDFAASMGGGLLGAGAMTAGSAAMRAAPAIVEPFRESGRRAIAGRAILESSADPQNLQTRINQGVTNPNRRLPGSPVTTAEAAQDTGLATLQSGMRNDPIGGPNAPKTLLLDHEAGRNAARTRAIDGLNPLPGSNPMTRGSQIRDAIGDASGESLLGGPREFVRRRLGEATGVTDDFYRNMDNLIQQRSRESAPQYERAMSVNAWSPRVDDFINDPIAQQGLARGFKIQRLESVARNQPFNPQQLGVTFNSAGDPTFVGRPNMRALDMVKSGLDDIIEGYRDGVTGRLNLDRTGKAVDEFRRSYVSTLDDINPAYKEARATWAGPSAAKDAMAFGREALTQDAEAVARRLQSMPQSEREFLKAGVLRDLQDRFAKNDSAAFDLFRNNQTRATMEAIFGRDVVADVSGRLSDHARRFGRDSNGSNIVGQILGKDANGSPMMMGERVAQSASSSDSGIAQVLAATSPQDRGYVAQRIASDLSEQLKKAAQLTGTMIDSAGNAQTPLSPAQIIKFVNERRPQMERVFPPDRMAVVDRLVSDLQETMAIANAGSARGSPTAQNLAVGNLISRTTNGLIDPSSPMAQTVASGGGLMRLLYAPAEARTRELLAQALVNPQTAQGLLAAAGPRGANRAANYLNTTTQQRLVDALMGGSARLGVTGTNAALASP